MQIAPRQNCDGEGAGEGADGAAGGSGEADTGAEGEEEVGPATSDDLPARSPSRRREHLHVEADPQTAMQRMRAGKRSRSKKTLKTELLAGADADFIGGEMMNENRSSTPVREEVRFTSVRHGGSTLQLRYCYWTDHEAGVITLESNGRTLHVAIQPHEWADLIEAATALCLERGWE